MPPASGLFLLILYFFSLINQLLFLPLSLCVLLSLRLNSLEASLPSVAEWSGVQSVSYLLAIADLFLY